MAQFWGAPTMALMMAGTGTLILGRAWQCLPFQALPNLSRS
jgi:hypothetical protein